MKNIYLDYNAHTPCDPSVIKEMNKIWDFSGNPHFAGHFYGLQKESYVTNSLEVFADAYGCFEDEIIFTSGATEANNLAIFSGIEIAKIKNPLANTILTSHLEHPSVIEPLKIIANKLDLQIIFVSVKEDGLLDLNDLQEKLNTYRVLWGSFCSTNGVIGTNQPITQITELCQQHGVVVHTDGSQSGYLELDFSELNIDYLTLSAHKIYGPSGVGLLVSKHLQHPNFSPQIIGGGQQEGLRAGTLSVPLIVGFAKAVELMLENRHEEVIRLTELRNNLLTELCFKLKDKVTIKVHGSMVRRQPNNLHIAFESHDFNSIDAMQLLMSVQPELSFSLDTACNGFNRTYSELMKTMGITRQEAESSIRISLGRMTSCKDIEVAVSILERALLKQI